MGERPDVFISYAREDAPFVEERLRVALTARGKDLWIDVEDIRGGAADWRASVWAGIEAARVVVFVLSPDSVGSAVCGEELVRAVELNKRIIPVLRRPVEGLSLPPALERPNWVYAREVDDFEASAAKLVAAIDLDEAWLDRHARYTQRTAEWLRHERDPSYLLRGSDLTAAERWLDEAGAHQERPTAEQITYITAGRRAAARRQRSLLATVAVALLAMTTLAVVALGLKRTAEDNARTARAQARAAEAVAALSRDPEKSVRKALDAIRIRADEPEAAGALRLAVAAAGWTALLRLPARRANADAAPLLDADFAAGGERVATASDDGRVAIWDVRARRHVELDGHVRPVRSVVFSPDGGRVLTASADGLARTWDSAGGRPLRTLDTGSSKDGAWAATYGAGGRLIATVSRDGAQIWDAASGKRLSRLRGDERAGGYKSATRLSADGRYALTAGVAGDAWLYDVRAAQRIATLRGGDAHLRLALFSGDDSRVATLDGAGTIRVFATAGGRSVGEAVVTGRKDITDADFSFDGRRVLTAGGDGRAEVWDVRRERRIALLESRRSISTAQFDRSGGRVVTGDDGGVARVWDVATRRIVVELRGHTTRIARARFSADRRFVLTASDDGSARVWRAGPQTPDDPRWRRANSATFGPDSRRVLVTDGARRGVWDVESGKVVALAGGVAETDPPSWPCNAAAGCAPWSPDGRLVAGADADGRATVWDARTGTVRPTPVPRSATVSGVSFGADGRRIVVVDGEQPTAQVWNLAETADEPEYATPGGSGATLVSAQLLAAPLRVLTVDVTRRARLSAPGTPTNLLRGEAFARTVVASRDGGRLAVGTIDGLLHVFSADGRTVRTRRVGSEAVSSIAFDLAHGTIASGDSNGAVRLWDARLRPTATLRAPGGEITGVTFSPRGGLVLATSEETTRLWDPAMERIIFELSIKGARAAISPDGETIVLAAPTLLEARRCHACAPLRELVRHARSLLPA